MVVFTCGSSTYSQFGHGNTNMSLLTQVSDEFFVYDNQQEIVVNVYSGRWFTVFLTDKFHVFSCGQYVFFFTRQTTTVHSTEKSNSYGQLGVGHLQTVQTPTLVQDLVNERIVQASGGFGHCIFLSEDGRVWGSGGNASYQLGAPETRNFERPELIPASLFNNKRIIRIGGGAHHTFFYTFDYELYSCGCNSNGELGQGTILSTSQYVQPQKVLLPFKDKIEDIQCGYQHTVLLTSAGEVYSFGINGSHELGLPESMSSESVATPTRVELTSRVRSVRCGFYYTIFLAEDDVYVAGSVGSNQLFVEQAAASVFLTRSRLTDQMSLSDIESVPCGGYSSYVVTKSHQIFKFSTVLSLVPVEWRDFTPPPFQHKMNTVATEYGLIAWFPPGSGVEAHFKKPLLSLTRWSDVDLIIST